MKYHHYQPNEKEATPRWGAVWAMVLCAMVLVVSEFMPVSLLTPIASDLHMSEESIAISGFFALLTSLWLTSWIGHTNRRLVLLFFTTFFRECLRG